MDALGNVSGMQTSLARAALASAAGGSTPATRSMVGGAQASWGGWARAKSKGGKFGKPVGVGLGLGLGVRPFWVVQTFASQRRVRSKAGPGGMGREPLHTTNLSTVRSECALLCCCCKDGADQDGTVGGVPVVLPDETVQTHAFWPSTRIIIGHDF